MPKEYMFLLIGLAAGGLLGAWIGRAWGMATAGVRAIGAATEPGAADLPPGVNLVVNGENVAVSAEAIAQVQNLLRTRKNVEAIKLLREATGLGQAEAKAVLDSLAKVMR